MEAAENNAIDLSWVQAAGGPELTTEGRDVAGLPEAGWWVWPDASHKDQSRGLALCLHTPWREPETGLETTLLVGLNPAAEGGVAWDASVLIKVGEESQFPCRGHGTASTFAEAHAAAIAWRPQVQAIDGLTLWIDPQSREGRLPLKSGELSWREGADNLAWRFKLAGVDDVMSAAGAWTLGGIEGESASSEQMLADVAEARERVRAAMRKFLLNF